LQNVESSIFIDNILQTLYKRNINVLTKHDSFLVPESQVEVALEIIKEELIKFLPFGFSLKVERLGCKDEKVFVPGKPYDKIIHDYFHADISVDDRYFNFNDN
jgi:hypothetical protein